MNLVIDEILINYEVPLLVRAVCERKGIFIGVNYDAPDDGSESKFYFVKPKEKFLQKFIDQKIDLRYLILKGSYKKKYYSQTWGFLKDSISCVEFEQELTEELLPEPRLFNPSPIVRSTKVALRKISIDGRWEVSDMSLFADLVRDCYAFSQAVIKKPSLKMKTLFEHYPWRGGSSSLNFFKDLSSSIVREEKARLTKMQYASPGFIEFSLRDDAAQLIKSLVENINSLDSSAKYSYDEARKILREKNLLSVSEADVPEFNDSDIKNFNRILDDLCNSFGLGDYKENINSLSRDNVLAGIKILLAFYRRLNKFADYSATGKAVSIFE